MRLPIAALTATDKKVARRAFFASLVWMIALAATPLFAIEARNIRFRHITPEDGLSQSTVHAIVQDREGFMWFGTQEGLNRYGCFEVRTLLSETIDLGYNR